MPCRIVPRSNVGYRVLCVDKNGLERKDDAEGRDGRMSVRILEEVHTTPPTNVFLYSHGWKGDVPAAFDQYDRWISAFENLSDDHARMQARFPDFRPMHVGLHWPSQPWGNERLGTGSVSFSGSAQLEDMVNELVECLEDTPEVRQALQVIVEEARTNTAAKAISPQARRAYIELDQALGLGADGLSGDSGSDREPFNPEAVLEECSSSQAEFGGLDLGGILSPLRQLSFWTMKKRAQTVGERDLHRFLLQLQDMAPMTRIHLMGHSFGCVVVSSMLGGPKGAGRLLRPVDSCVLVQGATSLWSYCEDIPVRLGSAGYFHRIVSEGRVRGPIVTTLSRHDRAVRILYPIAVSLAGQVDFAAQLPEYGAIGTFGIQGLKDTHNIAMLQVHEEYGFQPGGIHNLESSAFIRKGGGIAGAHSDIDGPEVAHVLWQAAMT